MEPTTHIDSIDPFTTAIYLEVPGSKVVLLQAYFELFEGVGLVRTLSIRKSLVCILTTPDLLSVCLEILQAIKGKVPHRFIDKPAEAEEQLYLGYFEKKD